MIAKLLIANRGEIACRIARTAKRMGIATVAVHSDEDAGALHVAMADEAVALGGSLPAETYLDIDKIIGAAKRSGVNAVHPGYGFLSENAAFAEACAKAGLIFVGPPPSAIHAMGDKARAKQIAAEAGVPVVAGYSGEDQSDATLANAAQMVGFPLLIKAVAGGGGRGMRRVERIDDFANALASARREAESAFGDGAVLLERLVLDARHIEIQIFADSLGNCIHLGERDCSFQRRHQKVIEEAPSPFVDAGLRTAMGADAVTLAKAVGYVGAGTVEFIVGQDGAYHFLEMNTRLQVEHPVTEMVTGLDLVEWQLRIAAGEALPLRQEDVRFSGHAVEARLYAENPYDGFRPQAGRVLHWRAEAGEGVRTDNGIAEGGTVTPFYDPMVAKIIAHGSDRAEAMEKLKAALRRSPLFGIASNRGFLIELLGSDEFEKGQVTTGLIDRWVDDGSPLLQAPKATMDTIALAAAILVLAPGGDWFRSSGVAACPVTLSCAGVQHEALVRFERGRLAGVDINGVAATIEAVHCDLPSLRYVSNGFAREDIAMIDGRDLWLDIDGRTFVFSEPDHLAPKPAISDPSRIVSPVSGLIRALHVAAGGRVEAGQAIAVIEAMKMETTIVAQAFGAVKSVHRAAGEQARAGEVLVEIEAEVADG